MEMETFCSCSKHKWGYFSWPCILSYSQNLNASKKRL